MRKFFATAVVASIACVTPAAAVVTVGNPAVTAGSDALVDTCTNCAFVINEAFGVSGLNLSSFSFFAGAAADITPLLLTRANAGTVATFTVIGIGTLRSAALGANTFSFATTSGTNITTANSYFGFQYGSGGGVVEFDYTNGSGDGTFVSPQNFVATVGSTFSADFSTQLANSYQALDARIYSINATAVPEPITWGMMVVGFAGMGYAMRRDRKLAISFS